MLVVHRALRAENVLVGDDYRTVRLTGFDTLREVARTDEYVQLSPSAQAGVLRNSRWLAPESLAPDSPRFGSRSDVWSFGVLLWEILTYGKVPFGQLLPVEARREVLSAGCTLDRPPICPDELHRLMTQCWTVAPPSARPSFKSVNGSLRLLELFPEPSAGLRTAMAAAANWTRHVGLSLATVEHGSLQPGLERGRIGSYLARQYNHRVHGGLLGLIASPDAANIRGRDAGAIAQALLPAMRHRGLLRLLGSATVPVAASSMLLFGIEGAIGTLREVLDSDRLARSSEPGRAATKIAAEMADAVAFLHVFDLPHGALSSRLVYLYPHRSESGDIACKWTAKLMPHFESWPSGPGDSETTGDISTISVGVVRWAAPEVVFSRTLTLASDVWSLGVMIWELCHPSSGPPYCDIAETDAKLVAIGSMPGLWTPGKRSSEAMGGMAVQLAATGTFCCFGEPAARPTIADVVAELEATLTSSWEVSRARLTPIQTLGAGQSGTVTKMATSLFCEPGETVFVAVKALTEQPSPVASAEFLAEIEWMKRLQHPNLVSLLGVCTREEPMYIVLEYLAGGSLDDWLEANSAKLLPEDFEAIAAQVRE